MSRGRMDEFCVVGLEMYERWFRFVGLELQ